MITLIIKILLKIYYNLIFDISCDFSISKNFEIDIFFIFKKCYNTLSIYQNKGFMGYGFGWWVMGNSIYLFNFFIVKMK